MPPPLRCLYYLPLIFYIAFGHILSQNIQTKLLLTSNCLLTIQHERPSLPEDVSPDLAYIIQSCWVEDPNMRPSFSQIIRMLNAFLFTISSPSPSVPESENNEESPTSNGTVTEFSSARARGKFAFLRQLFTAKKTKNSQ